MFVLSSQLLDKASLLHWIFDYTMLRVVPYQLVDLNLSTVQSLF